MKRFILGIVLLAVSMLLADYAYELYLKSWNVKAALTTTWINKEVKARNKAAQESHKKNMGLIVI